jgi:hypothetical protein
MGKVYDPDGTGICVHLIFPQDSVCRRARFSPTRFPATVSVSCQRPCGSVSVSVWRWGYLGLCELSVELGGSVKQKIQSPLLALNCEWRPLNAAKLDPETFEKTH